jgi:hypothetical protein
MEAGVLEHLEEFLDKVRGWGESVIRGRSRGRRVARECLGVCWMGKLGLDGRRALWKRAGMARGRVVRVVVDMERMLCVWMRSGVLVLDWTRNVQPGRKSRVGG